LHGQTEKTSFRWIEINKFFNKNKKQIIMYALKNKVQLIGNLGADPEVRNLEGGKKVAKLNMATSENYKNANGEKINETQWHHLVAWGKVAEIAELYLKKGSELAIEGKLTHRDYTDANGVKKYVTEVQVNEILLLDSKPTV
jgi:single-strand DNA-binding protein